MGNVLSAEDVSAAGLSDWRFIDDTIECRLTAPSYTEAAEFLSTIVQTADEADHHPDLELRYPGVVVVTLTTHSAGGVTQLDLDLAAAISSLAVEAGAQAKLS